MDWIFQFEKAGNINYCVTKYYPGVELVLKFFWAKNCPSEELVLEHFLGEELSKRRIVRSEISDLLKKSGEELSGRRIVRAKNF
jgi:hypothetical protein